MTLVPFCVPLKPPNMRVLTETNTHTHTHTRTHTYTHPYSAHDECVAKVHTCCQGRRSIGIGRWLCGSGQCPLRTRTDLRRHVRVVCPFSKTGGPAMVYKTNLNQLPAMIEVLKGSSKQGGLLQLPFTPPPRKKSNNKKQTNKQTNKTNKTNKTTLKQTKHTLEKRHAKMSKEAWSL